MLVRQNVINDPWSCQHFTLEVSVIFNPIKIELKLNVSNVDYKDYKLSLYDYKLSRQTNNRCNRTRRGARVKQKVHVTIKTKNNGVAQNDRATRKQFLRTTCENFTKLSHAQLFPRYLSSAHKSWPPGDREKILYKFDWEGVDWKKKFAFSMSFRQTDNILLIFRQYSF